MSLARFRSYAYLEHFGIAVAAQPSPEAVLHYGTWLNILLPVSVRLEEEAPGRAFATRAAKVHLFRARVHTQMHAKGHVILVQTVQEVEKKKKQKKQI